MQIKRRELTVFFVGFSFLGRGGHSPVELQRQGSALTLQQAPPLPHGHLTRILGGVEVDRCVIHGWLGRDQDRGGGGGRAVGGWVRDGMRRRRRAGVGVGGRRSEGRGRGWDEGSESGLHRREIWLCCADPIGSGGLVVGEGGGAGGGKMRLGWMCESHWFNDV